MPTNPVVYTAVFGNYDPLVAFPPERGLDYVCFTDDPALTAPGWKTVVVQRRHAHPRWDAKYFKLMPHEVFPDHDLSLWVDASLRPKRPFCAEALAGRPVFAAFTHPERGCLYDEAAFCAAMPKYQSQRISAQAEAYRAAGFPAQAGLFAGGVLVRRHQDPRVVAVDADWWSENLKWTYQDQLSLPVVLRRHGLTPELLPGNLWHNDWFRYAGHARDD